ncbi:MmgE/PrpD family protein [Alphaproteobacteria bacterium]|nr:MmgE/PrpD family protein [Alphaproteobacteria bacterium]MDC0493987.1 MmgE/PrpD family protein [Alphaproteobacteria bacterium]
MSLSYILADRIINSKVDVADQRIIESANSALLDTVGVTLIGSKSEATQSVIKALEAKNTRDGALIYGKKLKVSMLDAAMINGTSSHALDFDDCNNTMGGHPTVPILAGLLANSESMHANGRDVIEAYTVGVETICAMAKVLNFHHYEKGWHPTTTLGIFGAVAANARLQNLDVDKTATAIAIAASMASGIKANFGTYTKPYHVGHCTRNGLLAVRMADAGLTAGSFALEGQQGFFEVYNGRGNYDPDRLLEAWGDPFEIVEPGIAVKLHPCCGSTHPAVDAAIALKREHDLQLSDIQSVLSWTHPRRLKHTDRPEVKTGFDGKFSVQYVVSRALQNGKISLSDFSDNAVNEPEIQQFLATNIRAEPHPESKPNEKNVYYAELTITTKDGRNLQKFVDAPVGRDKDHPLPENALINKFNDCCVGVLARGSEVELANKLQNFQDVSDIQHLSEFIENATIERP